MPWRPRKELLWSEMLNYNIGICLIMFLFILCSSVHSLEMTFWKVHSKRYLIHMNCNKANELVRFIASPSMHFVNCLLMFEKKVNCIKVLSLCRRRLNQLPPPQLLSYALFYEGSRWKLHHTSAEFVPWVLSCRCIAQHVCTLYNWNLIPTVCKIMCWLVF